MSQNLRRPMRRSHVCAHVFRPVYASSYALVFGRDAYAALRREERAIRRGAPRGRANETLISAYTAAGATTRAFRLASYERTRLSQRPSGDARWAWEAAYPMPHFETLRPIAEAHDVPWEQVYATMPAGERVSIHTPSAALVRSAYFR